MAVRAFVEILTGISWHYFFFGEATTWTGNPRDVDGLLG